MRRCFKLAHITKKTIGNSLSLSNKGCFFHTPSVTGPKPRFNLREKIPISKDAPQVLRENPGITFIGIFNNDTKEITLMPAMKEKNLEFYYNDSGEIVKSKRRLFNPVTLSHLNPAGKEFTQEELEVINRDHQFFLPRFGYSINNKNIFYPSHNLMLFTMGITEIPDENPFYGFSVIQNEDGSVNVNGNSLSLNRNKPGTIANCMCKEVQAEIEKIIQSWFSVDAGWTKRSISTKN